HLLRARRERNLAGRDLVALADDARDLRANLLDGDVEALEDAGRKTLLLAQQAEQDVLGAAVVVLERTGRGLSENDHLACPLGEPLEHEGHIVAWGTGVPSPPEMGRPNIYLGPTFARAAPERGSRRGSNPCRKAPLRADRCPFRDRPLVAF